MVLEEIDSEAKYDRKQKKTKPPQQLNSIQDCKNLNWPISAHHLQKLY